MQTSWIVGTSWWILGVETAGWLGAVSWGLGSLLWVEVVRDVRHWLAHEYPRLMPKHYLHHRLFTADLNAVSEELYRESQWHHDVPESVTMMIAAVPVAGLGWLVDPFYLWMASWGIFYSFAFLAGGVARGNGWAQATDLTHQPGPFIQVPSRWWVNRTYHWRHHFDNTQAYYCGTLTLVDQIMGTALSLKGKMIAVTGASGTLGQALLQALTDAGATVVPLSTREQPLTLEKKGKPVGLKPIQWSVGREVELQETLQTVDILIVNHGINVHGERTPEAIETSYEVNTFSQWRLMELFFQTVQSNADIARKEVWVNTSEAEVIPAISPLYELSKRAIGDLVTLRRLDAPCVVRKLILGPFKSNLNPIGVMSASWVAQQIVLQAKQDRRNIIVTINPLTFILFPLKEFWVSTYFKLFSRPTSRILSSESAGEESLAGS